MLKKMVLGMGFFIIFLTLTIIILIMSKDYNSLKPQVVSKIKSISNIEISINGDVKPTLSPFGFEAKDIKVLGFDNNTQSNISNANILNIVFDKKSAFVGKSKIEKLVFKDKDENIINIIYIK